MKLKSGACLATLLLMTGCAGAPPRTAAQLIASGKTWGNTEGPAFDSKGTLLFCARGSFKGIVAWNEKDGGKPYVAIDSVRGPGGLWIDAQDNIFVTGPGERKVFRVSPDKTITVLAENFEPNPTQARGPNDLVVTTAGTIYFTDPNGFEGDGPPGTIYRLTPGGKVSVFDNTVVGPNGITISRDERSLFVAGNVAKSTSKVIRLDIRDDGAAGSKKEIATVENCIADGMDLDRDGNVWLTCYSFGTAHRISPRGRILETITTDEKALTNCQFGRGADAARLYLTSSDMARETGYVYRFRASTPGFR